VFSEVKGILHIEFCLQEANIYPTEYVLNKKHVPHFQPYLVSMSLRTVILFQSCILIGIESLTQLLEQEKIVGENETLKQSAKEAYRSYILAYHSMKDIFNVHGLDLKVKRFWKALCVWFLCPAHSYPLHKLFVFGTRFTLHSEYAAWWHICMLCIVLFFLTIALHCSMFHICSHSFAPKGTRFIVPRLELIPQKSKKNALLMCDPLLSCRP
jgi:hypothetical protein